MYFTLAVQVPDGHPVSFDWFLDNKLKSKESKFRFNILRSRAQVKVVVSDPYSSVSKTWLVILEIPVSVEEEEENISFTLKSFPNLSNTCVQIRVHVPQMEKIYLESYDILGRRVCTLANGSLLPGNYTYVWDGSDKRGIPVATGVYICRFTFASGCVNKKIMVLT